MTPFLWIMLGISLFLAALWFTLRYQEQRTLRWIEQAADAEHRLVIGPPPPPFDRLTAEPDESPLPQLVHTEGAATYTLWLEPDDWWGGHSVIVMTTHPHERAYRETALLMNVTWEPAGEERTIRQATDLIRRLYLEGRDLHTGQVWQGFQLLATLPASIEAQLPDDLPRTAADAAYQDLTRILLLYRHTILLFNLPKEPRQLRAFLTLAAGLAPVLNEALGPLPNPFTTPAQ